MGVSYRENNPTRDLQNRLNDFEDQITTPNNRYAGDFVPVDPNRSQTPNNESVEHNLFTSLAKDGEYIIKKGFELVINIGNDLFNFIFGAK